MKTNKELKEEYKRQNPIIGVFQLRNKINGKLLIEGSTNIPAKWNRYRTELKFGSHRNQELQKDWIEHREENFEFTTLSKLEIKEGDNFNPKEEVKALEDMIIEELGLEAKMRY